MAESEYLVFTHGYSTGKTDVWYVLSRRSGYRLGVVKWYGPWRQYCFWPDPDTVFNRGCMGDIDAFIAEQMAARQQAARP